MRVILSAEATADIDAIALFGTERFGPEQAQRYADGLRDRLKALAGHPRRYGLASAVKPGLRTFAHRRHRVFYFVGDDAVIVVRILHQQADARHHLP